MKKTSLQFHAKHDEIAVFLRHIVMLNALYAYGIVLFPYKRVEITEEICDGRCKLAQYQFVVLSQKSIGVATSEQWYQFCMMHRGALFIDIGKDSDTELVESVMGVSSDEEISRIWVRIIERFRKRLLRGTFVKSMRSDVEARYDPHRRYSEGARQAYDDGVTIRASAGWCCYELRENV